MPYEEELPPAIYEGFWSRLLCDSCGVTFDLEDDVSNGDEVECDACGEKLEVTGR